MNTNSFVKYNGQLTGVAYANSILSISTDTLSDSAGIISSTGYKRTSVPGKMTVDISACDSNAIKIHLCNHKNRTHIYPELVSLKKTIGMDIEETENHILLTANMLKVTLTKNNPTELTVSYYDKVLTKIGFFYESNSGAGNSHEIIPETVNSGAVLSMMPNENFYGLGGGNSIHLNGLIKNVGTNNNCSHVPFFISSNNYGILVNTVGMANFNIGGDAAPETRISVPGEEIEFVIMAGNDYKEVMETYASLVGTSPFSPNWSYGVCLSLPEDYTLTDERIISLIDSYLEAGINYTELYLGKSWLAQNNCHGFSWDTTRFPDPGAFIRKLHDRGIYLSLGVTPYISDNSAEFAECYDCNYLVNLEDDSILMRDTVYGSIGILDFSHLGARNWLQLKLDALLKMGVDYFRGEYSYEWPNFKNARMKLYSGQNPEEFSYSYAGIFSQLLYESAIRVKSMSSAFAICDSASAGSHNYSSINIPSFKINPSYSSIAAQIHNSLSYGMSGYGVPSIEVPSNISDNRLYSSWLQFALMTPHCTVENGINPKSEGINIYKMFISMRAGMLPYFHSLTCESKLYGIPTMRPMCVEFPKDLGCEGLTNQFMLGASLLIAPILSGEDTSYYVPSGLWTDLLTRERIQGPCYRRITSKTATMPILVRQNSIIPTLSSDMSGNYDMLNNITFTAFELVNGTVAATEVYTSDASRSGVINILRDGNKITVKTSGLGKNKRVVLMGIKNVVSVSESVPTVNDFGTAIDFTGNELSITLG